MYLNHQTVVVGSFGSSMEKFDSSLARIGLHRGDILKKMNGKDVFELREHYAHYVGGSTPNAIERDINSNILRGKDGDTAHFTVDDGEKEIELSAVYQTELRGSDVHTNMMSSESAVLEHNIGYIDMGQLEQKNVRTVMKNLFTTQAIIFDVRNYPRGSMYAVMTWLSRRVPFAYFSVPLASRPGYSITTHEHMYICGDDKGEKYKGKIVILANELTQSHAEFTIMSLQSVPGAITIGSQTTGADGNVSIITLPGQIKAYYTGLGVFYPDGRETQRAGIKIDIPCRPTIPGIREGRDEVLERAMRYILSGQ
jgi:C-terminal processing protease CtpA/Prc